MHMQIEIAIKIAGQAQAVRPRPYIRHGCLRRLLHDVPKLAGQCQLAFAVDHGGLGAQNRASHLRPGKPRYQPHFALLVRQRIAELDYTQEVVDVGAGHRDRVVLAFLDHFARNLAADVSNFTLQVAHSRLAGVGADQRCDGFVRELHILFRQARRQHLLLDQE